MSDGTRDEGVLDPRVVADFEANPFHASPLDLDSLPPEILAMARGEAIEPPSREIAEVTDDVVDGVPIRTYRDETEPTGLVVYFHGGGFCIGSIGLMDNVARELARRGRARRWCRSGTASRRRIRSRPGWTTARRSPGGRSRNAGDLGCRTRASRRGGGERGRHDRPRR